LAELLSARLVWVRRGGAVPPLQPLYDGPYAVIRHGGRSFTLRVGQRDEIVAVSRLKACTTADAAPGSPRRRGRPPGPSAVLHHLFWDYSIIFIGRSAERRA
jgi:hypothetical protein